MGFRLPLRLQGQGYSLVKSIFCILWGRTLVWLELRKFTSWIGFNCYKDQYIIFSRFRLTPLPYFNKAMAFDDFILSLFNVFTLSG